MIPLVLEKMWSLSKLSELLQKYIKKLSGGYNSHPLFFSSRKLLLSELYNVLLNILLVFQHFSGPENTKI
jgi:hypothetical protein